MVTAFLQEVTESGATRRFDMSDAVILGQAGKPGKYSGQARFAKYAKNAEESKFSYRSKIVKEPEKPVPKLKGCDGEKEDWEW